MSEINDPTGEAGFSVSFRLYDSHGVEKLITMRAASLSDGETVLRAANELTTKAIEKYGWTAWTKKVGSDDLSSQSQTVRKKAQENGDGQYKEFDANTLIKTYDDGGEMRIKIKGKPFEKFGVPVYEEDFSILGIDLDELRPGAHPFNHRVKAILKDDGNPRKIVEVLS